MTPQINNLPPSVLLFLKAPRPGFVKTRLAKDLGDEKACQTYRKIAEKTLSQIPSHWPTFIYFTPDDALPEMTAWLGDTHRYKAQSSGDLGQRLTTACNETFSDQSNHSAKPSSGVILLGGDCPELTTAHLQETAEHLAQDQTVIGPAKDGGYWLLGLPHQNDHLFENIPWSSSQVYDLTLQRMNATGIKPHFLEALEDIDDLASWTNYQKKQNQTLSS